jgi:hypothetical protein
VCARPSIKAHHHTAGMSVIELQAAAGAASETDGVIIKGFAVIQVWQHAGERTCELARPRCQRKPRHDAGKAGQGGIELQGRGSAAKQTNGVPMGVITASALALATRTPRLLHGLVTGACSAPIHFHGWLMLMMIDQLAAHAAQQPQQDWQ